MTSAPARIAALTLLLAATSAALAEPPPPTTASTAASSDAAMSMARDIATIRALRERNNRALAAHDLDATMQIVGKDFVLVGGNSGIDRSRDEDRKAWAEEFAVP